MIDGASVIDSLGALQYGGLFLISLLENVFIPVPEEIYLLVLGYLSAVGIFKIVLVAIITATAFTISDSVLYYLARSGNALTARLRKKIFGDDPLITKGVVKKYAKLIIFVGRFLVAMRWIGPVFAGAYKIPYKTFLLYNSLALIVYVPAYLGLGFFYHGRIQAFIDSAGALKRIGVFSVAILSAVILINIFGKRFVKHVMEGALMQEVKNVGDRLLGGDLTARAIESLREGGVGVLKTDTLYGLVGSAFSENAVEKIYALKGRDPKKPLIVLISDINELQKFSVAVTDEMRKKLNEWWGSGKSVSVVLPLGSPNSSQSRRAIGTSTKASRLKAITYLHRGTDTIAFRIPEDENLREFLIKSGPLVAPSANPEGQPPAKNIEEAKKYFGARADFYLDGGAVEDDSPSMLVALHEDGHFDVLREGAFRIE